MVTLAVHFYGIDIERMGGVASRKPALYGHVTTEVNGALYNIDIGVPGGWHPAEVYHAYRPPDISLVSSLDTSLDFDQLDSLTGLALNHRENLRYLRDYYRGNVYICNLDTCTTMCRKILGMHGVIIESHIPDTIFKELLSKQWQKQWIVPQSQSGW